MTTLRPVASAVDDFLRPDAFAPPEGWEVVLWQFADEHDLLFESYEREMIVPKSWRAKVECDLHDARVYSNRGGLGLEVMQAVNSDRGNFTPEAIMVHVLAYQRANDDSVQLWLVLKPGGHEYWVVDKFDENARSRHYTLSKACSAL